jgi:hypothetical protein
LENSPNRNSPTDFAEEPIFQKASALIGVGCFLLLY